MLKLFRKKNDAIAPQWIIIGLGNTGCKYQLNRHNAGFLCIDRIAEKHGITFDRSGFESRYGFGTINGQSCILAKPQTFMNNSGIAASKLLKHYDLPPERMLVISDDISFAVGKMRIRRSGSAGGQKGLKSIIEMTESQQFPRIKIGVGEKPADCDLGDWVLSDFNTAETEQLESVFKNACEAAEMIINGDTDSAMANFN